jgi:hypothetical protein
MDQVSRPVQIALLAALSFAVLWFIALRPKDNGGGGGSAAPVAPVKASPANRGRSLPGGLGKAVGNARKAQAQENGAAQRSDQASNSLQNQPSTKLSPTPTAPTPAAAPKVAPKTGASAPAPAAVDVNNPSYAFGAGVGRGANGSGAFAAPAAAFGLFFASVVNPKAASVASTASVATAPTPRPTSTRASAPAPRATSSPAAIQQGLAQGKVVVLLFWSNRSSDDQAVHSELSQVGSYGGRALVASAPIRDVSRYGAITSGIQVLQSPTIVVVDRLHRAKLLTGYTDHTEIGQAVASALVAR